MLVGLLSGRRGVGVLRAKQPTLREPAVAQSAHTVRSLLRCTCRLSRNGGLRDRGCLAPKAPLPSDCVKPPSAAGPRLLPSASLEYGPSGLSFYSPGVSAGGAAVVAAHEPALLGMRGLYYNCAGRSLLNADSLPTRAHPMAASSASPLSTDTYGSTAAAAAASRAGWACAVNGDVRAAHAAAIVRWSTSSGGWQCCRA